MSDNQSESKSPPKTSNDDLNAAILLEDDTPRMMRHGRENTAGLRIARDTTLRDLNGEMIEISPQAFCDHYLPLSNPNAFERTIIALQKSKDTTIDQRRWTQFPYPEPEGGAKENDHFKKLEQLIESVCSMYMAQDPAATRTVLFSCRANQTTASEIEGAFMSDAIFYLAISSVPRYNDGDEDMFSADVVLNAEFKLEDNLKEVKQNRLRMLDGAAHCMNNDPRRCHMFSMSIERDNVRLWFYSRSHSSKSASFSLSMDIELLAHLIVSLSFATEKDLGYDTTITRDRERDSDQIYYIYTVGDHKYKTVKCISEYSAKAIPGRATRVWSVEDIIDKSKYVLKDYWLEEGQTEKDIQEAIYQNLESVKNRFKENDAEVLSMIPEAEREDMGVALDHYRQYFVNIESCTKLGVSKAPPTSYHQSHVLEDEPLERSAPPKVLTNLHRSVHAGDPTQVQTALKPPPKRIFRNKQHCRLLYKEECMAFYELKDLKYAMTTLYDSVTGLQLLYLAGFVHRDISAGNVLCYVTGDKVVGKLGDLEYARPFPRDGAISVDPKTGTPGFIAIEVAMRTYAWCRPIYRKSPRALLPRPPFQSNFLHDLESVFWLTLWLFTTSSPDLVSPTKIEKWRIYQLFSFMHNHDRRLIMDEGPAPLQSLINRTFTPTLPSLFSNIEEMHASLHCYYGTVEDKRIFTDPMDYAGVHGELKVTFQKIIDALPAGSIPLERIFLAHRSNPGATEALPETNSPRLTEARNRQVRVPNVQVTHNRRRCPFSSESGDEDFHDIKRLKIDDDVDV